VNANIWIPGPNPFNLPPPPQWWQNLVAAYDKRLRLFASQKDRVYRLGWMVDRNKRLGLNALIVHSHPDTVLMIQRGCVPVSTLLPPGAAWSPNIIRDLRARDTWRFKTNQELIDAVESQEASQEARQDANAADDMSHVNAAGYRYLKTAVGERVSLADVNRGRGPTRAKPSRRRITLTDA
jgi:hypothetical protein